MQARRTDPAALQPASLQASAPIVSVATAVLLGGWAGAVGAQAFNPAALRLVPTATATATLTDNFRPGNGPRESDSIMQFGAGLNLSSHSRLLTAAADYMLSGIAYARHSHENQHQQALNATMHSEWLENRGFLEASATIARQSISAFGTQSADTTLVNANSTESRSLHIAPSLRGSLADLWSYTARVDGSTTRTGAGGVGNSSSGQATLQLNRAQLGRLAWGLTLQRSLQKYAQTRDTVSSRLYASAQFDVPEADLKLSASGGRESSNATTVDTTNGATWGAGLVWAPSPRTRVDAQFDRRQYGPSHSIGIEYRSARTVWRFASSQSISTGTPGSSTTTNFALFYSLFASLEPDPAKRTQRVNTYLQQNGIDPNGTVQGSFITQAATESNQQSLSFALQGLRSGLTVSATTSNSRQADPTAQLGNSDLANGQHVRQSGFSANLSHRLTPSATVNLLGGVANTAGTATQPGTKLRTLTLSLSGTPSRYATITASLRHSSFASPISPYRENAAVVALNLRFQ